MKVAEFGATAALAAARSAGNAVTATTSVEVVTKPAAVSQHYPANNRFNSEHRARLINPDVLLLLLLMCSVSKLTRCVYLS